MESEFLYDLLQLPKEVAQPTEEELQRGASPSGTRVVGSGRERNPNQNGKHFQTLFTTVTVTKSSLEKKMLVSP